MPSLHRIVPVLTLSVCALLAHCGGEDAPEQGNQKDSGVPDSGREDAGQGGGHGGGGDEDAGANHDSGPFELYDAGGDAGGHPGGDAGPPDAAADSGPPGTTYTLTLTTAAESPPCTSAGPVATGSATVLLDSSDTWLGVFLTYENLSSAPTMGHIHYGAANTSGPIVLSLGTNLDSPIQRYLNASNYYAAQGAPVSFAAFLTELKAGKAYLNLHTESCPDGEIRSQIQ